MTEFFEKLTAREKEIINFLIEKIKESGEYKYTVRQLVEELKMHHKTLAKTLVKAEHSGHFVVEDLGLRKGYRIKFAETNIEPEKIDSYQKDLQNLIPQEQNQEEELVDIEAPEQQNNKNTNTEILIGRNTEIQKILDETRKRKDVLLFGSIGTGKTAILKEVVKILEIEEQKVIYADYSRSLKQFLVNVIYQLHTKYNEVDLYEIADKNGETKGQEWKNIKRKVTKLTTNDLAGLVLRAIKGKDYIIVCDALEMITPTAKSIFESLREYGCLIGATHTLSDNPHLRKLWWRFKHIEIKNLDVEQASDLIDYLYTKNEIHTYNKEAYKKKVLKASHGNCSAIYDMIFHTSKEKYLDEQDVRDIRNHGAGAREIALTPFYIFAGVLVVMTRFIALGMNNKDIYILAGMSGALFMFVRFYMLRSGRRRQS